MSELNEQKTNTSPILAARLEETENVFPLSVDTLVIKV